MPQGKFYWIDENINLLEAINDVNRNQIIAIDTEYDSFHYFREKLCLIQIQTLFGTYLVDPINVNLNYLSKIFKNKMILKIFHAGDNDLRILKRDYNFNISNIFDTQRAAALLGSHYLSLTSIIYEYLGIELKKTKEMQCSQWDLRPLTIQQTDYAIKDIKYLIPLYFTLKKLLQKRGLEKKAKKTFINEIDSAIWTEKVFDSRAYTKIEGFQEMKFSQKKRLAALCRWRFNKAKEINCAAFLILSNRNIVELAKERIYSIKSLFESKIISEKKINQYGVEIIETIITR